jgi:hypothetical protein
MQPTLRLLLLFLLAFWLGTSVFFSFLAAPELFHLAELQVITRDQAGNVAAALLKQYFLTGAIVLAGTALLSALLAFGTGQPRFRKAATILLVALVIALFDGYVWGPKVHQIREERRAHPSLNLDKKFGKAHAFSFGLNFLVIVGTSLAFGMVVRQE